MPISDPAASSSGRAEQTARFRGGQDSVDEIDQLDGGDADGSRMSGGALSQPSQHQAASVDQLPMPDPFGGTPDPSPREKSFVAVEQDQAPPPPPDISHSEPSPPLEDSSLTASDPLQALRSSIQNTPLGSSAQRPPPLSPTPPLSQGSFLLERASAAVWPVRSPGRSREGSQHGSRSSSRAPGGVRNRIFSDTESLNAAAQAGGGDVRPSGENWYPTLIARELFMPLPNTDPLQTLLSKYVPPPERPVRDTSGAWRGRTIDEMVASSSWRSLATYAYDNIVSDPPSSLARILQLWTIRLQSILSLLLPHQHLSELTHLFTAIQQLKLPQTTVESAIPFELEVFWAKRKSHTTKEAGGAGEGRGLGPKDILGAVEDLCILDRRCRQRAKQPRADAATDVLAVSPDLSKPVTGDNAEGDRVMWLERSKRLKIVMAGMLADIREYPPAIALLAPLLKPASDPSVLLSLIHLHVASGTIADARSHLEVLLQSGASDGIKRSGQEAIMSADSDWEGIIGLASDSGGPSNATSANNLAVALLNSGELEKAASSLNEQVTDAASHHAVYAEPLLFNVTTIYELQSGSATQKKVKLLKQMAEAVGDGLRPGCLKLS